MEELSMLNFKSFFRLGPREIRGENENSLRIVPASRREKTVRSRKLYGPIEVKSLTPDEIRDLPVAHRNSA